MSKEAQALAAKINKQYGAGTMVLAADMTAAKRFPSGSLSLDIALGGGWAGNQWAEIIGLESHGKTAVILKTIAACQYADSEFMSLWVAAEPYDFEQAAALGVDNSRVMVVTTRATEEAYSTLLEYAASRTVDCLVLDSYPALIPNEEEAKGMEEFTMAAGAKLTNKFFRKAGNAMSRSLTDPSDRPIIGFFINQWRDDIGGWAPQGSPKTTTGGKGKNYSFYTRVEVKRDEFIDEARPGKGKVRVGQSMKIRTIKNKAAAPQQVATVKFYFRDAPYLGFERGDYDVAQEIFVMGVLFNVIRKAGAWYAYGDYKWNGKEKTMLGIRAEPELQDRLLSEIMVASKRPDEYEITEEAIDSVA